MLGPNPIRQAQIANGQHPFCRSGRIIEPTGNEVASPRLELQRLREAERDDTRLQSLCRKLRERTAGVERKLSPDLTYPGEIEIAGPWEEIHQLRKPGSHLRSLILTPDGFSMKVIRFPTFQPESSGSMRERLPNEDVARKDMKHLKQTAKELVESALLKG